MTEWQPIANCTAKIGQNILVYRPLAQTSGDDVIAVKRYTGKHESCWDSTVPDGHVPCNPTNGLCHVTHWQPLTPPPEQSSSTTKDKEGNRE